MARRKLKVDGVNVVVDSARSISDYMAQVNGQPISKQAESATAYETWRRNFSTPIPERACSWMGVSDWDDLQQKMTTGVLDYNRHRSSSKLDLHTDETARRVHVYAPSGPRYSVQRFLTGNPMFAHRTRQEVTRSQTISVCVDPTISKRMSVDDARQIGLYICDVIDAMEAAGYSIGLETVIASHYRDNVYAVAIETKRTNGYTPRSQVVAHLSEPFMTRYLFINGLLKQTCMKDYRGAGRTLCNRYDYVRLMGEIVGADKVLLTVQDLIKVMQSIGKDSMPQYILSKFMGS